jgi:hypothetical protein
MSGLDGVVGEAKIAGNWSRGGVWSCRGTRYAELFLILYLYLIDRVGRGMFSAVALSPSVQRRSR